MNLRRMSSAMGLPDPERLRGPPPKGSVAPTKTWSMIKRRQLQLTIEPIRLSSKPGTSKTDMDKSDTKPTVTITKPPYDQAMPGPSRQLILSTPAPRSDTLDGISELPPSATTRGRILRSDLRKKALCETTSRISSGLKLKMPSSKIPREKSMITRGLATSTRIRKNIAAPHQRLRAVAQLSVAASPLSGNSTDQFEADELAAALPTPAPLRRQLLTTCQANCSQALEEMKNFQQELVLSHKQFLDKQAAHFEKHKKLIEKQTEVLCKLSSLLDKNIELFNKHVTKEDEPKCGKRKRRVRSQRHYSINKHSDSSEDNMSGAEKENEKIGHKGGQIGHKAVSEYNDIRSEFSCLRLKTPGKGMDEGPSGTPKTPRSILSRTLQMQLGDIFEES